MNHFDFKNKLYGAIFGLAIGDALGAPIEFRKRGTFDKITDYKTNYNFEDDLLPGSWTDDTSMTLALMDSITECNGIHPDDQLQKYVQWFLYGKYSVNGNCFDIGDITTKSLLNYITTHEIESPYKDNKLHSGSGALMRMIPLPLFMYQFKSVRLLYKASRIAASTTHPSSNSLFACEIYCSIINTILNDTFSKDSIENYASSESEMYDVESILHSACWAVYNSNSFEETVINAVNLGGDADTIGAVAGSIAGCIYGFNSIPSRFIDGLQNKNLIYKYIEPFYSKCIIL